MHVKREAEGIELQVQTPDTEGQPCGPLAGSPEVLLSFFCSLPGVSRSSRVSAGRQAGAAWPQGPWWPEYKMPTRTISPAVQSTVAGRVTLMGLPSPGEIRVQGTGGSWKGGVAGVPLTPSDKHLQGISSTKIRRLKA